MSHPDPMWVYDLTSLRFLAVNNSAILKYGYSREEFLAMTIVDIRPAEDEAALKTNVAAVTEGRDEAGVWRHVLKSGQVIYVDITSHTLTYEGRRAELVAARDVSRLVLAERAAQGALAREEGASLALRRTKRLLEIAGNSAKFGAWRYDISSKRLEWSPETARIHDEPEGFSPTLEQAIAYYAPEYRDRIATLFETSIDAGKPYSDVLEIISAKGRRRWVRATGEPERDDNNQIIALQGSLQDITEYVVAQEKANELSSRLAETLESISDAFMLLDHDWRFVFLNSQAARLAGMPPEDLIGRTFFELRPEAIKSPFQIQYERAVRERKLVRFTEFSSILGKWLEVDAHPTPLGLAVYFRDVTDQRARDEQLRLLDVATSCLNDILLITEAEPVDGPDGPKIVYVNDAFERRTGFSREEAIGKTPRILQGPKTQRDELDRIKQALKNWQPVRSELINYTKSGEEFWLELNIVPVADETGRFTHWVAVERDITQRKRVEQALLSNEERFRLVNKAAGTAIWEWDVTRNRDWWSDGFQDIFGHAPDGEDVAPQQWSKHIHPEDKARVDASLERLQAGAEMVHEHYRFQRADGSWAHVEDRAFALRDQDGKVTRILGSMSDVSERVQLEERLLQSQKMEAIGQLTGGIAHDFNNLLTIVLGNAEILAEDLANHPQLQRMAELTMNAAERGADLTNRLLAFARKQPLEPKVVELGKLMREMEGLLRRVLPENIDLEIIRAGGLWRASLDAGQLETALLNLALNARDAMPDGGCLTIEMANAALDDDYVVYEPEVKAGQYVVITVTDTGHGIPREYLDRVFEPFFTTKSAGKGSGLGLSMVFGFVKQSGGHIRAYSEPDEGTSFKLYFPRSQARMDKEGAVRPENKITGGTETVFVVEDEAQVREHVASQLVSLGYDVVIAQDGVEALQMLNAGTKADLLFTDVVMPGGVNGRELAQAARALYPQMKVLFTSGYTENSIVHNGRLDRGVELLSKPYRRAQLAAKIRKILDSH